MKSLIESLAKPIRFAVLIGVTMGTLVYSAGKWIGSSEAAFESHELAGHAHKIAAAYLLSAKENADTGRSPFLTDSLESAVQHPLINAASFRSSSNEILSIAQKKSGEPGIRKTEFSLPLVDSTGAVLGRVVFELAREPGQIPNSTIARIRAFSLFGAFLGFGLCVLMLRRNDPFLPVFIDSLRKIGNGNLEVDLPEAPDGECADLAAAIRHMLDGLRERDRMRHSLGRIMDPKIAEALIKEDPKVGGLRRQATILFCDIRNYTSLCEQMSVDELQEFLNEYWKGTVEIIMEQEGTIDKFHGDGVCVVFGAPAIHADDPLRAVRVAWRLVENVRAFNKRRESLRKIPIHIGIGIHSGEVIAGHIGSERRMDYTVVGDVVNVAARIEELNKKFGTNILISDNVYEKVEPFVRVKTLTLAHLRGHKRPILIHSLIEFNDRAGENPVEQAA